MNPATLSEHLAIRLAHTDAAGVLFYPRIFDLEHELFERWLELGGFSVRQMLERKLAPTPIVHCEADYRLPVRTGDVLTARLAAVGVGRSGYTLKWTFSRGADLAMRVVVKRVAIDPVAGESIDLPEKLRAWLLSSQAKTGAPEGD
ncbi:MAG: acyl-CoA thioesterase [Planctomycetaceae bacterium]|nr:acyl-CoA thioesterase [Planctomycetaceae bacterium]